MPKNNSLILPYIFIASKLVLGMNLAIITLDIVQLSINIKTIDLCIAIIVDYSFKFSYFMVVIKKTCKSLKVIVQMTTNYGNQSTHQPFF